MATRTIVTSQPDVACDVCERRLLRGEQPDVFLAAGRRRIVCELCAPRAAHEGWLRESQSQSLTLPPLRPRRGRSLIDKLRQVARPAPAEDPLAAPEAAATPTRRSSDREQPYDFLDGYAPASGEPDAAPLEADAASAAAGARRAGARARGPFSFGEPSSAAKPPPPTPISSSRSRSSTPASSRAAWPGVARSLGAPAVNIRSAEHVDGAVAIVVAWELCWYRYEVDLGDESLRRR